MALDVYVMPIWKFKAGDFASPLERFGAGLGLKVKTIGPGGAVEKPRGPGLLERWRARRETHRLRSAVRAELGRRIRWNDDGDVVYSQQSHGFESLRAYAMWLDYRDRFPTFDPPPEGRYYNHPIWSVKEKRPLKYSHLVDHDCYAGYYLPTTFDRIVRVEPYTVASGRFTFHRSVGSTQRLLENLVALQGELNIDENWKFDPNDALNWVKASFTQLLTVAKLSRDHDLPIIFFG